MTQKGYYRISQLAGSGRLPVSRSTIWRWVAEGRFPKPVKLSARVSAWRVQDIEDWMKETEGGAETVKGGAQ